MAYYSAVALSLHKEDEHQLVKRVGNLNEDILLKVCALIHDAARSTPRKHQDYVVFYWNYLKWYEKCFPEVDFIMNFMKSLKHPYDFIRIGEDFDDTYIHNEAQVIEVHRIISIS